MKQTTIYNAKIANHMTCFKIVKKLKRIQFYVNFIFEKKLRLKNNTKKTMLNRRFAQKIHDNTI